LRRFKKLTLTVIMALLGSALVASPALATSQEISVVSVTCSGGGTFTVKMYPDTSFGRQYRTEVTESANCTGTATIPVNVNSVGPYAFANSLALSSVVFAQGIDLTYIGPNAFLGHPSLSSITIPSRVSVIDASAFANASLLASVTFGGNAPTVARATDPLLLAFRGTKVNSVANIGASATGFGNGPTWEGLTLAGGQQAPAAATVPTPYSGPLPTNYSDRNPSIGGEVTISGPRLNLVTSCTIDGVSVSISNQSADSFTIIVPEGLAPGLKDLVMTGSFGKMTAQGAFTVAANSTELPLATAKTNSGSFNGYVAVYVKGYKGKTLSWKIAGKWFTTAITSDYQIFQRRTVAVGLDVNVHLYLNGEKESTRSVTTR
jgi:hypothetical protein